MNPISPLFEKIDASIGKKVDLIESSYARYALRSIMACAFLTLGTGVAYGIAIKGEHIVPGLGKMLYAFMFSWSLVMILYMNAELGTSNMLYMTVGYYRRRLNFLKATKILWTCILFNLIGGIIFAYLLSLTGPFQDLPHNSYLFESAVTKLSKSTLQIFIEGIFANIVVNVAVLVSMRMKDDAGKVLAIIFIIFIFAYLGFEHVIANFPFFTLAYFASNGTIAGMDFGSVMHNLTFALLGNYVGGGLIIGLGYAWLNNTKSTYVD